MTSGVRLKIEGSAGISSGHAYISEVNGKLNSWYSLSLSLSITIIAEMRKSSSVK